MTTSQKKHPLAAGDTRQGYEHSKNEDNFGIPVSSWIDTQGKGYLYIVADGVGGHAKGDVASKIAIDRIPALYYAHPNTDVIASLNYAIETVNQEIFHQAQQAEYYGMGSTIVIAVVRDDALFVANLGDSRAYLFSNNQLRRLTADHAWIAEQVARGTLTIEEGANHPQRNVLTRALGTNLEAKPDIRRYTFAQGDRLLLCSDGVWGMIESEFTHYLQTTNTPQQAASALVNRVAELQGADDATVIVISPASEKTDIFGLLTTPRVALFLGGGIALFLLLLLAGTFLRRQTAPQRTLADVVTASAIPTVTIPQLEDGAAISPIIPTAMSETVDILPTATATQTFCIAYKMYATELWPAHVVTETNKQEYLPVEQYTIKNGKILDDARPRSIKSGMADYNNTINPYVQVKYNGEWVWILQTHLGIKQDNDCKNYFFP